MTLAANSEHSQKHSSKEHDCGASPKQATLLQQSSEMQSAGGTHIDTLHGLDGHCCTSRLVQNSGQVLYAGPPSVSLPLVRYMCAVNIYLVSRWRRTNSAAGKRTTHKAYLIYGCVSQSYQAPSR